MTTNTTPTHPETLEPNVHALTVLVCQDCIDLKGEMCNNPQCVFCRRTMAEVQRYLDVMLLCPVVDGRRLILVGDAVTDEDTRRAAVAEPRRDGVDAERVAATIVALWRAENSDDGTLVKYIKQSLLGARIGAAATSSSVSAESDEAKCIHCQHSVGDFNAVTELCEFDPEPENESAEFCGCKCEFAAPAERTRVEGEQSEVVSVNVDVDEHGKIVFGGTSDSARRAAEVPNSALVQLLNAALLHPESAEGYIRRVIEELSRAPAPTDDDAESLLPELTAVFVTNAIRVHTLSNHGYKWHDCLADVCHNNKELIQRARGE